MDLDATLSASHSCAGPPDTEGAATWQRADAPRDPAPAAPTSTECPVGDAESVGRPVPPTQEPSDARPSASVDSDPTSCSDVDTAATRANAERFYRLLSKLVMHVCLAPSSSVGDHPATLVVGVVVQSAFHGVEPPAAWLGAVSQMPPQIFQISGLAEIRRWLRRAVSEWQHCPPGTDAAPLEARIKNMLSVRDVCKRELGRRYPAWMGAMLAASWGATEADWEERSRRQAWIVSHFKLKPAQIEALSDALAEFKAGCGSREATTSATEGPSSSDSSMDEALRKVATGDPGAVERYVRLDDAIVETVAWQQCVATCAVLFPYATEKVSLIEALVASGPSRPNKSSSPDS